MIRTARTPSSKAWLNSTFRKILPSLVVGLWILVIWQFVTSTNLIKPFFLPSPFTVSQTLWDLLGDGSLRADIIASFCRVSLGLMISAFIALPLGLFVATKVKFARFISPSLRAIRFIPPPALVPLTILWFGIGENQKLILLTMTVAPYLAVLVIDMCKRVPREYLEVALTLGCNPNQLTKQIIIPMILPEFWDSLRLLTGPAWSYVVVAEMVAAESGLGHLIIQAERFLQTDKVVLGIMVIGLIGLLSDYLFAETGWLLFPWSEK